MSILRAQVCLDFWIRQHSKTLKSSSKGKIFFVKEEQHQKHLLMNSWIEFSYDLLFSSRAKVFCHRTYLFSWNQNPR